MNDEIIEKQIRGRFLLMYMAKVARVSGVSAEKWRILPEVKETCSNYHLDYAIVEHVSHWTWTFRK